MFSWLIDESGQVVGRAGVGSPSNLTVVEGVEASDRDLVYFDGTEIVLRPSKPDGAVWAIASNEWVVPVPFSAAITNPSRNWEGLVNALRGSEIFGVVWTAALSTVRASTAYGQIMNEIGGTRSQEGLIFALGQLRSAMRDQASLVDFTAQQLIDLGDILAANGFDRELFDLAD